MDLKKKLQDLAILDNTMREEFHTVINRVEFTTVVRYMMIVWNVTSLGWCTNFLLQSAQLLP